MKVITETELRARLTGDPPSRLKVARDTLLTPAAGQFLRERGIEVVREELPASSSPFVCQHCGGTLAEKPEHLTHLYQRVLVFKTHPRIKLRGKLEALQGSLVAAQIAAAEEQYMHLVEELQEILSFTRQLLRAEVLEEPLGEFRLMGMSEQEVRQKSHEHWIDPAYQDGKVMASLNLARVLAREAELMAVEAFIDPDGEIRRGDLVLALNRLSSLIYILMCRLQRGRYRRSGTGGG